MSMALIKCLGYGVDLDELPNVNLGAFDDEKLYGDHDFFNQWKKESYEILKAKGGNKFTDGFFSLHPENGFDVKKHDQDFGSHFVHDSEFGEGNTVVFIPVGHADEWHRRGNSIDCFEEALHNPNNNVRVDYVNRVLYPYFNLMRPDPTQTDPDLPAIEKYWEPVYMDKEDADVHVPYVPISIWFMMKAMNIVPEEDLNDLYMSLTPCVYTLWR